MGIGQGNLGHHALLWHQVRQGNLVGLVCRQDLMMKITQDKGVNGWLIEKAVTQAKKNKTKQNKTKMNKQRNKQEFVH